MELNQQEIDHVAELARLKLTDEEKNKFMIEISEILNYVAELEKAPTENIESISQITGLKNVTRKDKIIVGFLIDKVLQNAPGKKENFIKTKKVFE